MAMNDHIPLDQFGITISLGRKIITEKKIYQSTIYCEWDDGRHVCVEMFRHESKYPITGREMYDLAGRQGWVIAKGKVVCPCHNEEDIERMIGGNE